jgi:hypothetical protein
MRLPKGSGKNFQDRTALQGTDAGRGPEPRRRFERKEKIPMRGDGSMLEARFRDKREEGLNDTWRKMNRSIRKDGK